MLAISNDILPFIPQRYPVVMIDTLYSSTEEETKTGFTILKENIFCEDGCFSEAGLIENIAQTAAIHAGYLSKKNNRATPIGFIGAIKNLQVFDFPKEGDRIVTTIVIENEVFGVTLISGTVVCNEKIIATAGMKIVIKSKED